jgi:regulator of protease activity HflC (stomatin/prohibitin superfamily)
LAGPQPPAAGVASREYNGVGMLTVAIIILLFGAVLASLSLRIVFEYERLVVFRLGRCIGARGPGPIFLIPFVDRPTRVDLREQYIEIPHQTCITKDNAPIGIDFLIYSKVVDPVLSVVQVRNFAGAAQGLSTTTLRAVIGDILLDDVLAKREEINARLRAKLDEVTERWGVKVTTVEIREIVPPREIQAAMNRQMSAERTRRALVTESEGQQQAAILVAEGEKEAAILRAEGDREAAHLRAEGYALALTNIYEAARTIDAKTMSLQYLETLRAVAAGPATKWVIPAEFAELLGAVVRDRAPPPSGDEHK